LHDQRWSRPRSRFDLPFSPVHEAGGVEQNVDDVARHQAEQHEDDDRDAEQRHQLKRKRRVT